MNSQKVFRHELKYFINHHEYHVLKNKLKHVMKLDKYSKDGEYHIRSLYFDDFNDTALFEKQLGLLNRKKYRIRIYNLCDDVIKLEKKSRKGQFIHKETLSLSRHEANSILDNEFEFLLKKDNSLAREFYMDLKIKQFKPKVIVDYVREAYTLNYNNIRITFDKFLKTGLENKDLFNENIPVISAIDESFFILEIKYSNFLPDHIKSVVQIESSLRQAISKYVYCRKFTKLRSWEDQ
jgi:hypothetical protein